MVWNAFVQDAQLTAQQEAQFEYYRYLLIKWNERMNLTTIVDDDAIVRDHFEDSIKIAKFFDFNAIHTLCDIGSGAGFPGVPLKILFPHLGVVLLEVRQKRIEFLKMLCDELRLINIAVSPMDWRAFLRWAPIPIGLFCARASLAPDELVRMFKPGCTYKNSTLVYWASEQWQPEENIKPFITQICPYTIGDKKRQYIILNRSDKAELNK